MFVIAIIGDIHDWHSQKIKLFLEKKKCEVIKIKYDELESYFSKEKKFFLNQKLKNVDGVWLRFINNGSLEEITTKLTFYASFERTWDICS